MEIGLNQGSVADNLQNSRVTLGQQVLDVQTKYAGQKTQTIRETTDEMGKKYMQSLWNIIGEHNHITEDYYISEFMKTDSILPNTIHCKHVARLTMPLPEWGIACFRVSNRESECFYEWGLPSEAEGELIKQNPLGWDVKTVDDVTRFLKYLEMFNKCKPPIYGNYHSMPMDAKAKLIEAIPLELRQAFEAQLEAYWLNLLKKDASNL